MSATSSDPHAGQAAASMTLERATELVTMCIKHVWYVQGLSEEPPPDLSDVGLVELLAANHLIARLNREQKTCRVMCADRLVAAIYVATHYQPTDEVLAIIPRRGIYAGRAVAVVSWDRLKPTSEVLEDEDE